MNFLKKINYQIETNPVNQEKKIKFNDQNSLLLIYRQIFFLLFDLFAAFLTYKYIINKINRLKTLGLDFYSLIKLIFSAFIISTLLFFVVDICSRILNFVLLFSERKRLIDEQNSQNQGEIEIFKSGEEIFFEIIISFFIDSIFSIFKSFYNLLDKIIFIPSMNFAKSFRSYFENPNKVKEDFLYFCKKTYYKTKEICNKGFEILKKIYNFCIESLKFILNLLIQNVLIPIAGKINDLLEKNFKIKDTVWNNTPIKSIEKDIKIDNKDYKIQCSLYQMYKKFYNSNYILVLSYDGKNLERELNINNNKVTLEFDLSNTDTHCIWAQDLFIKNFDHSSESNNVKKYIKENLIDKTNAKDQEKKSYQDPRWNSNFVLDSIYEYLARFREKNQEINTVSL